MNPSKSQSLYAFCLRSFAGLPPEDVDTTVSASLTTGKDDKVATTGNGLAEHVSRLPARRGFNRLMMEIGAVQRGHGGHYAPFASNFTRHRLSRQFQRSFCRGTMMAEAR